MIRCPRCLTGKGTHWYTAGCEMREPKAKVLSHRDPVKCYACDDAPVQGGVRDRRPDGGDVEPACARHADPTIRRVDACIYCNGAVRTGSLVVDGDNAHRNCHAAASR